MVNNERLKVSYISVGNPHGVVVIENSAILDNFSAAEFNETYSVLRKLAAVKKYYF